METISAEEVVKITIGILKDIRVPAGLVDEIGIPVSRSIKNLQACVDAWEKDAAVSKEKGNDTLFPEDPVIEKITVKNPEDVPEAIRQEVAGTDAG